MEISEEVNGAVYYSDNELQYFSEGLQFDWSWNYKIECFAYSNFKFFSAAIKNFYEHSGGVSSR